MFMLRFSLAVTRRLWLCYTLFAIFMRCCRLFHTMSIQLIAGHCDSARHTRYAFCHSAAMMVTIDARLQRYFAAAAIRCLLAATLRLPLIFLRHCW